MGKTLGECKHIPIKHFYFYPRYNLIFLPIVLTYLNVCGISSKLLNPDFETLINNSDILVLVETKTDEYDNIKLPNEYAY
jgi:hypothetical protein